METIYSSERLLMALAEQLKSPLVQIAQLSELAQEGSHTSVSILSKHALRSVDAFLRSEKQMMLELEPVSVGSVMYDVAHELAPLAKEYGVELRIDERGRGAPIMAKRKDLELILTLLGGVLVQSPAEEHTAEKTVVLGSHTTKGGIIVGAFGDHDHAPAAMIAGTRKLYGRAPQAASGAHGLASVALADKLAAQLQTTLRAYKHGSSIGMGALFVPSKQLRLVS